VVQQCLQGQISGGLPFVFREKPLFLPGVEILILIILMLFVESSCCVVLFIFIERQQFPYKRCLRQDA
jgi:hypothetical protein